MWLHWHQRHGPGRSEVSADRAERRRQARAEAKRHGRDPVVGVYTESAFVDTGSAAELPAKVAGRHRWIVTAGYTVSDQVAHIVETELAGGPPIPTLLDHESRFMLACGCYDCEAALGDIAVGSHCPGDPSGTDRP